MSATGWRRLHLVMTVVWFSLVVPTVIFWADSVLWVALISCYANAVGHFSAWQATRAEESDADEGDVDTLEAKVDELLAIVTAAGGR